MEHHPFFGSIAHPSGYVNKYLLKINTDQSMKTAADCLTHGRLFLYYFLFLLRCTSTATSTTAPIATSHSAMYGSEDRNQTAKLRSP